MERCVLGRKKEWREGKEWREKKNRDEREEQ